MRTKEEIQEAIEILDVTVHAYAQDGNKEKAKMALMNAQVLKWVLGENSAFDGIFLERAKKELKALKDLEGGFSE